jgi:hypothetical protein
MIYTPAQIREMLEKATKGPLEATSTSQWAWAVLSEDQSRCASFYGRDPQADAELFAAAPTIIKEQAEQIATLTEERDAIEATCRKTIIGYVIVATVPQMAEMLAEQAKDMQRQRVELNEASITLRRERDRLALALRKVMEYPDIRQYLGSIYSDIADSALATPPEGEQTPVTRKQETE